MTKTSLLDGGVVHSDSVGVDTILALVSCVGYSISPDLVETTREGYSN